MSARSYALLSVCPRNLHFFPFLNVLKRTVSARFSIYWMKLKLTRSQAVFHSVHNYSCCKPSGPLCRWIVIAQVAGKMVLHIFVTFRTVVCSFHFGGLTQPATFSRHTGYHLFTTRPYNVRVRSFTVGCRPRVPLLPRCGKLAQLPTDGSCGPTGQRLAFPGRVQPSSVS